METIIHIGKISMTLLLFQIINNFEVIIDKNGVAFLWKKDDRAFFLKNNLFMLLMINKPHIFSISKLDKSPSKKREKNPLMTIDFEIIINKYGWKEPWSKAFFLKNYLLMLDLTNDQQSSHF